MSFSRRRFLQACALLPFLSPALSGADASSWYEIGCFNRPWTRWGFGGALKGVKEAGYATIGLLTRGKEDPLIGAEASKDYLDRLKGLIQESGLKANIGSIRSRHNIPVAESAEEVRKQISNAAFLGLKYVMSFGVDKAEEYEHFYKVMADAAAFGQDKGVQMVMKPHGGGSGASEEILRCVQKVKHPNFKVWYDAGNIIHYTGKDPVAELEPVANLVTGFCAKDCASQKGEVMIQLGSGKVDFKNVFARLKKANFHGPIMLEGSAVGSNPEETTRSARENRIFLETVLRSVG